MYTLEQIKAAKVRSNELPFEYTKKMTKSVYYSGYDGIDSTLPSLNHILPEGRTTHPDDVSGSSRFSIIGYNEKKKMVCFDIKDQASRNPWYMKLSDMIEFGIIEGSPAANPSRRSKPKSISVPFNHSEFELILL